MFDRVPVPTDNIYKFYALFSLVALIFCIWLFFSKHAETNAITVNVYPEIALIKALKEPTPVQSAKLKIMEQQIEVAKSDRSFINKVLGAVIGASLFLMVYGFSQWHKEIQPLVDASNKAQLEILQLQIEQLKLENQKLAESLNSVKDEQSVISHPEPSLLVQVLKLLIK
ncbi:hypothetical protein [Comamonas sp. CMM02]|uniref:hypothetical protein n=1 Tax=Comamonas sp. CMM02 TaxID=2769307 RepID=UPI00177CE23C|nr:hypothetical protein [Comamonas sp. CMM02]MBD9402104.1 hypothetical protein [Comamonas sp. CMM02]